MATAVESSSTDRPDTDQSTDPDAAAARATVKADAAALRDLTAPVRSRIRLGQALQVVGSACTVVPFIGIVELGRTLLADGPVDATRVWIIVAVVVIGLLARGVLSASALTVTHYADVDLQRIIRRRLVTKLGRLPLGWFTRTTSGKVRQSVQQDVGEIHYLVAHADVETTAAVATPVFALIYCFVLDWRLGLLAIATLPVYALAYAAMAKDSSVVMTKMNASLAAISSSIVEFISGIAVVKTFGRTGQAHRAFRRAADDFNDGFAGYVGPMIRLSSLASILLSAPLILLINLSGAYWFIRSGWVTPIEALGGTLIAMMLPASLMTAMMSIHSRQTAASAAGRIAALLRANELPVAANPVEPRGSTIELERVDYTYPADDGARGAHALRDVSLTLQQGTLTALVGASGSGKSTLATLIPRFVDPDAGTVRIGGADVRDIDPDVLYRHVGFVLQDVALLDMSVAENIALGRPDSSREEIEDAARTAQIHDRIVALPEGYDTVVGRGAHFSGGEAQRVAIARALLCDAPILVLDEATAFADPESEATLQRAISALIVGRTVLVIAHRLSSVVHADTIVVLDGGRIVEQGRHDDLVGRGGTYAGMWRAWRSGTSVPTGEARR